MANYTMGLSSSWLPLQKKYRSRIEIIALILEAVKYTGAARYSLMKHTSINYAQLKKYLKPLTKIGFIEMCRKEDKVLYMASEKGLAFLRQYNVLRDMLLSACSENKPIDIIYEKYNVSTVQQYTTTPSSTPFIKRV